MEYREIVYKACTKTDFNDKEDAIRLTKWLAQEAISHMWVLTIYEEKLAEVMTAKDYHEFIEGCAIKVFRSEVESMEESDFKSFALEHFDEIISDVPVSELIENYKREHGDGDEVS